MDGKLANSLTDDAFFCFAARFFVMRATLSAVIWLFDFDTSFRYACPVLFDSRASHHPIVFPHLFFLPFIVCVSLFSLIFPLFRDSVIGFVSLNGPRFFFCFFACYCVNIYLVYSLYLLHVFVFVSMSVPVSLSVHAGFLTLFVVSICRWWTRFKHISGWLQEGRTWGIRGLPLALCE